MCDLEYSEERKGHLDKLETLVTKSLVSRTISTQVLTMGSWKARELGISRPDAVQIMECIHSGEDVFSGEHEHSNSREIFIVIEGTVEFKDGTVLKAGDIEIVPPCKLHNGKISEDGYCIVLVIPPEVAYS